MSSVAQIKTKQASSKPDGEERFDSKHRIDGTVTPELVIGLCGPLGTPLHRVAEFLESILSKNFEYRCNIIKLSDFIKEYGNPEDPSAINSLIDAGNSLRDKHGPSVLAQLAIRKIASDRSAPIKASSQEGATTDLPESGAIVPTRVVRNCHIIDSIKNKNELEMLRSVYGKLFHLVSVYSTIGLRLQNLENRFGKIPAVYELIDRDSGEETKHGQSVRDIFPLADFFLKVEDNTDLNIESSLLRYINLLLGTKVITPTSGERAMHAAYSAARNSACLSRQVGAAISDESGSVLSVGWNDVPRAFGGLYDFEGPMPGKTHGDHRCWNLDGGKCFNDLEKTEIARRLTVALEKEGIIEKKSIIEVQARLRGSSELKGLIEFSRAVHAEMHALLNAGAANGSKIRGAKLYVTTYPCHSCARHIVAAGISEVRFIEPYRKSLATRLHADAITESESDTSKVRIIPFDGVAPSQFIELFKEGAQGRKDKNGKMKLNNLAPLPVTASTLEAIETLEGLAIKELNSGGLLGDQGGGDVNENS